MMSLRALGNLGSSGAAAKAASLYYSEHSADYYVKDASTEPEGQWIGEGAAQLGLTGSPEREVLQLALAGKMAGHQVQNAGEPDRQMGWDVTFSAPKSVSLAWGLSDDKTRLQIEAAHEKSAFAAHQYLSDQITTRRGHAGHEHDSAQLVSAQFTHHTSRAGDPQLHSHIVIPNFCVRPDGSVGTIESKAFYEHKLTAGALYQAELAYRMKELGYEVEKGSRGTFRLGGVNTQLEELFSKRDQQIDQLAREREIRTYAGTRGLVLATRPPKKHTTLEERQAAWRTEARGAGLSLLIERGTPTASKDTGYGEVKEKVREAGQNLTSQNSTFQEKDFIRELARSSYGTLNAKEIRAFAEEAQQKGIVVQLGQDKRGRDVFTTPEMAAVERRMLESTQHLAKRQNGAVDPSKAIRKRDHLSEEQKASLAAATGKSGIAVIQGRAGTGKTTTLSALRESYEQAGWNVQGITLSGQAAQILQKESGISSTTIASWRKSADPNSRTVIIVDEAGMVGSKTTAEILQRVEKTGAKVVLVGDERQLQPIEAGGALHAVDLELIRLAPEASSQIQTIRRQKEPWMREAVLDAARGHTGKALQKLDAHKKIGIYENAIAARKELVRDYLDVETTRPKEALILTHRKGDAALINRAVRRELQERGLVGENRLQGDNGQRTIELAVGDRVMMTQNNYQIDVRNGQRGTLRAIDERARTIRVHMDNGLDKEIALDKYPSIEYGWASTTHKAQGATVERAYVYGHTSESMASQQSTYVQISRARSETKIYVVGGEKSVERPEIETTAKGPLENNAERNNALEEMAKTWGRDAMKDTTLDYLKEKGRSVEKWKEQPNDYGLER